jgi:hypothetical protein
MFLNYSKSPTPETSSKWKDSTVNERINQIKKILNSNDKTKNFKITKVPDNGQIEIKIEELIPSNKIGIMLIELETLIKKIDEGLSLWCEPVGDKSVLRKLRGVKITT